MSRHLIIHWPDPADDRVRWVAAGDDGRMDGAIESGTLDDAADAVDGRRVTLVIAGDGVLLSETQVPGGSASRAPTVVRYALEEQLADDVDDLHFALGAKVSGDVFPVAVIDRDTFETLLARLAEAGLRPLAIVAEPHALPLGGGDVGGDWCGAVDGERVLLRFGDHAGLVTDTDMLEPMLDGALAARMATLAAAPVTDDAAPSPLPADTSLTLYTPGGDATGLVVPAGIEVETRRCRDPLELFAATLGGPSPHHPIINLLQGEYSPRREFDRTWKPWRWTAALAAGLLAVLLVGRALEVRQLGKEEAALDAAIAGAFEQALPGTPMRRPRRQIEQALGSIGGGAGGGFTERFAQIADSLATQPQTRLNSLSVRGDRFDLDLVTDAVPTLDALKTALESRGGLVMEVQSAVADGDGGIRARARIQ